MPHDIVVRKTCLYCRESSGFEIWQSPVCNSCILEMANEWKQFKIRCSTLEDENAALKDQLSLLNETRFR